MKLTPSGPGESEWRYVSPEELARLCGGGSGRNGKWRVKCPVHGGDTEGTLEISQGDQTGKTMAYCYAHGCSIEDICAAVGITVHDLDPYGDNEPYRVPGKPVPQMHHGVVLPPLSDDAAEMFRGLDLESRLDIIFSCAMFEDWTDPLVLETFGLLWHDPVNRLRITQEGKKHGIWSRDLQAAIQSIVSGSDAVIGDWRPGVVEAEYIVPKSVDWLWSPYIPIGKLTLMVGDPGQGKSWLTLALATAVSKGAALPSQNGGMASSFEPSPVLLFSREDGIDDTIVPRLISMEANLRHIRLVEKKIHPTLKPRDITLDDLVEIEQAIDIVKPFLVVIDPIQAFIPGSRDMNKANEVREVLSALAGMAERRRFGCVVTMHMNKATQQKALYRASGSIDFTAIARSVLLVAADPDQTVAGQYTTGVVSQVKNSLMMAGVNLGYRLDRTEGFSWLGAVEQSAEALINPPIKTQEESAIEKCKKWLRGYLSDGAKAATEVFQAADDNEFAEVSVRRAKKVLGVKVWKQTGKGGQWMWELSDDHLTREEKDNMSTAHDHIDHLDHLIDNSLINKDDVRRSHDHLPVDHLTTKDAQDDQGDHTHNQGDHLNNIYIYNKIGKDDQGDQTNMPHARAGDDPLFPECPHQWKYDAATDTYECDLCGAVR